MSTALTINPTMAEATESGADFLRNLSPYVADISPLPLLATEGPEHIMRYVNGAFCCLSGQTQEELVGHSLAEVVLEGERNGCAALLDRVYLTGKAEVLADQEHAGPTPSSVYWSYTGWAVFDGDEHPSGVMLQVIDTTEAASLRRQSRNISEPITVSAVRQLEQTERAEEDKERLHQAMRETEHRMKNHLQSVCALLDIQTLAHDELVPVGELVQIRSHIRTLALIHDLLTRDTKLEETTRVLSVLHILRQLLPMLQEVVGIAPMKWSADDSLLPIKQGISLAIIVNELVTNAVKHGGKTIELEVAAFGKSMTLTVCDDGPGFPEGFDPRAHAGFGLELLESMTRLELGGRIAFENQPEGGACVVIVFPIPVHAERAIATQ